MPVRLGLPTAGRAIAEQGALKAVAALVGLAGLAVPVLADPAVAANRPGPRAAYDASSALLPPTTLAGTSLTGPLAGLTDRGSSGLGGPAVSAVLVKSPAAPSFGVLGFTAVAKPTSTTADTLVGRSTAGSVSRSTARISGVGTSGLTAYARTVLVAITWAFPQITNVIGVRPDSLPDHPAGRAIDFMIPSPFSSSGIALGNAIVADVQAHASAWHISYIMYRQRIWLPGSGWRAVADRGSPTANHMDHVHVSVD
jgi:hypothetical protein